MLHSGTYHSDPHKIALIGNYLPRQCGIATFTTDLLTALTEENAAGECWAMVMNDVPEGYRYPGEVRFDVNQRVLAEYRLAADFLNMNRVEVVCLQHEFGIFGGDNGAHVLDLLICDNYATHKYPNVRQWLKKHPRFHIHFTPTSASWLNMVERFFRDLTTEQLRRGVFTSVPELISTIENYMTLHNEKPKPFIWTASAKDILQKVIRANSRLRSKQNEALH